MDKRIYVQVLRKAFMSSNEKMTYYFTVSWDGISEETEGSVTYTREVYEDAVEGIKFYLAKYKNRLAYPSGLSLVKDNVSVNLLTTTLIKKLTGE